LSSQMQREAQEAPAAVADLLQTEAGRFAALGAALRREPPAAFLTVARGSSDHAAQYLSYLVMARLGRLVTSLPMSVLTLYHAQLQCHGLTAIALSQSGQSPDLVQPIDWMGEHGARTIALVNDADSPLAHAAQLVIPLHAGPERSVAATKSCLAQLTAGAALVSAWQQDPAFDHALQSLPDTLQQAASADWSAGVRALIGADRLYVIGRGTGLPIAMEAALKFKEVCGIHAEAFSGAEVQHGPMALVEPGFPLLVLAPAGPSQPGLLQLADAMRGRGARVVLVAPPDTATGTANAALVHLPLMTNTHADLEPISVLQSLYRMIEGLARARGLDPDAPRHLQKVTRTR
jgi:glutamine---fructose-6-phosphate transaminase (isomerizing)